MQVSDDGLKLIASFEGFSSKLYNDPSGNCTIGYGFLVHMGKCDGSPSEAPWRQGISEAEGRRLLAEKVQSYADVVARTTRPDLTQHEFDALVSLCYNIGPGGYLNSTVRTAVNARGDVCAELQKYVYGSDGVAYPGLVRRRNAECALYNTPDQPVEEDEDMKPFMAWDKDRQRAYLIGPFGAAWITQAADVATLEGLYGKTQVALSAATIDALG